MTEFDLSNVNAVSYKKRFLKVFTSFVSYEMMDSHTKELLPLGQERISLLHELHRNEVDLLILNMFRIKDPLTARILLENSPPVIRLLALDRFRESMYICSDIENKEPHHRKIDRTYAEAVYLLLLVSPWEIADLPSRPDAAKDQGSLL